MELLKEDYLLKFKEVEPIMDMWKELYYEGVAISGKVDKLENELEAGNPMKFLLGVASFFVGAIIGAIIGGIIGGIIGAESSAPITLVAMIVVPICIYSYLNKKLWREKKENELNDNEQKLEGIIAKINTLPAELKQKLPFLAEKYCTYNAIISMQEYLETGRANTLAEMINLFEDDEHKRRMEEKQEELLYEQKISNIMSGRF